MILTDFKELAQDINSINSLIPDTKKQGFDSYVLFIKSSVVNSILNPWNSEICMYGLLKILRPLFST